MSALYKDGKSVKIMTLNDIREFKPIPEQIRDCIKFDILQWLIERTEPIHTITLGKEHKFVFTRTTMNVKTSLNSWMQYSVAICPDYDELISVRTGVLIDEDRTDGGVCKNEIVSVNYGRECIPLGYVVENEITVHQSALSVVRDEPGKNTDDAEL